MKQIIRLTEGDLHNIVKESVDRMLKEYTGDFGYSDDPNYNKFAQQNRPQQKQTPPLANYQPKRLSGNLVSHDGGESYMWDDSQQRQLWNNGTVVESTINEILDDPYDYAKVKGLSAAAFKAARTPGADPKWAERKMRQSDAIKDRWRKLANEYSKSEGNNPYVDWAMSGQEVHNVDKGLQNPKDYIRRNGYGNYLKGVTESDLHRIVKESVKRILKENQNNYRGIELQPWMTGQQWKELVDQALDVNGWSAEEVQMAVNGINQPKWQKQTGSNTI